MALLDLWEGWVPGLPMDEDWGSDALRCVK